jgi:hypothetical protein
MNDRILYLFPKIKKMETTIYQCLFDIYFTDEEILKFKEYESYDEQTKIYLLLAVVKNLISKYGNISQIFSDNSMKKNSLRQCLANYDLTEKEEGDKDFVNLEELSNEIKLKNENENKEFNDDMDNKFKVIKEVDEDKEEENDEEEEEIKDMNKHDIIEDIDNEDKKEEKEKEKANHIDNKDNKEKKDNKEEDNNNNNSNEKHINDNNNNGEQNEGYDMDVNMMNDEEIVDKILIEEFRKKYKNNKYYFKKIDKNEYSYNNMKIRAVIDKDGDIKIVVEEKNEEYYLDDFIKLFNGEEKDINKNINKDEKKEINNSKNNLNIENKDINNANNELEDNQEEIEEEEEDENQINEHNNNDNENGI